MEGLCLGPCWVRRLNLVLWIIPDIGQSQGCDTSFGWMMQDFPCSSYWPISALIFFTASPSLALIISTSFLIYMTTSRWCQLHLWFGINSRNQLLIWEHCKGTLFAHFLHPFITVHDPEDLKFDFWYVFIVIKCSNIITFIKYVHQLFRQYRKYYQLNFLTFYFCYNSRDAYFQIPVFAIFD